MLEVEAVKDIADRKAVYKLLAKRGGDIYADIWQVGLTAGLRISDLVNIKFDDINDGVLKVLEKKTKKPRTINLCGSALATVARRKYDHPNDTYLFQVHSNRQSDKPISRISVSRKFKEVGDVLGIRLGTHSMRKTLGYHLYTEKNQSIEFIRKIFNHSSSDVTLRYIGIEQGDIKDAYLALDDMM